MAKTNKLEICLSLTATMKNFGTDETEAEMLYNSLSLYAKHLVKYISWDYRKDGNDHKEATMFFDQYQTVVNMKRVLFADAYQLSSHGYDLVYNVRPTDKEKELHRITDEYCKYFKV